MKVKECYVQLQNKKTKEICVHKVSAYVYGCRGIYRDKTKGYPWIVFDTETGKAVWFGKYFKDAEKYVKYDPDKVFETISRIRDKDSYKEKVSEFKKMIEEGKIAEVEE